MPEYQTCVLVTDDDWGTRTILSDVLAYHGYEPLVASDGEQALALAATRPLDVACVDLVMLGPAGLELARRLKALQPQMEVILITAFGSTELVAEAMRQGAFYYLNKPLRPARLLEVVEEACAEQKAREQTLGPLKALTRREREALAWLAEGKTDPEIAQELRISKRTVSTHVRNLLCKLGVKNRVQAAVLWERCAREGQRR
jgi:DNA-binding NarL/FixJ family response regulator